MNLSKGTILQDGKYRIIRFIKSGGFGCTYEAKHVMLGKRVAIKEFFVKDFCNRDGNTAHITVGTLSKKPLVEKLKKKFINEAIALSQLDHPGIVRVSDVFEENGTAYFVMDYIDGLSLEEIVKKEGAFPEERALCYIRQICDALSYVHAHNRLHLDIKPGNIMVNSCDKAILIDFGASKQYDEEEGENTSTLVGKTPGYAPLEQMGNAVTTFLPATDIYSIGATLYKLLSGSPPLSSNLLACGEELAPLSSSISATTTHAIYESMKLNKRKRPQSIEAFIKLLDSKETPVQKDSDEGIKVVLEKSDIKETIVEDTIYVEKENISTVKEETPAAAEETPNDIEDEPTEVEETSTAVEDTPNDIENEPLDIEKTYKDSTGVNNPPISKETSTSESSQEIYDHHIDKKKKKLIRRLLSILVNIAIAAVIFFIAYNPDEEETNDSTKAEMDINTYSNGRKFYSPKGVEFTYWGETKDSLPNDTSGKGVYADGTYVGAYVDGSREGNGTFTTADGKNLFEGEFKNDEYSKGKLTFIKGTSNDGEYFIGTFNEYNFHTGRWYYKNGQPNDSMYNGKYVKF